MTIFKDLQARHEELINKAQLNEDVVDQAQKLIADIKKESSKISSLSERDQLRANLRYWASYVYEKSGAYPNVELDPSIEVVRRIKWQNPFILAFLGLIIISVLSLLFVSFRSKIATPSITPHVTSSHTSVALPSETFQAILATSTENMITPTMIEVTQVGAMAIEITSPIEGGEVPPLTILAGTYSNLPFGYSVHAIVMPLSKDGTLYPMKEYATVSPNAINGTWKIGGRFIQGSDLEKKEEFKIQMVAAMNDKARLALNDAVESGMKQLPDGVIPFPQTVNVSRAASTDFVNGVRLIYSSFLDDEGNYEIFTANTDGSDIRRITYTSGFNEYFPSLSPDGTKIVYVGKTMNENNKLVQSIEVINVDRTNSDNTQLKTIVHNDVNVPYESPLWSSDGRYIAYAAQTPQKNGPAVWNIYIYDFQKDKITIVTKAESYSNRYFSWIPNSHEIVFDSRILKTGTSGFLKVDVENPESVSTYFDTSNEELHPAVSPDGKRLAYVQLDKMVGNLYVVELATKKIVQLTTGSFFDNNPAWSPDGKTLFFDTAETEYYTIWSVKVDGSSLTQITFGKDKYPFVGRMEGLIP